MTKKIKIKNSKKRFSNTVTYKLLMTLDLFFLVFSLTLIALYFIGNYQNFLDKSQLIILNVLSFSSIFTILMTTILIIETLIKIFTERHKIINIFNLLYLLITIIFSVICIVVSCTISYISLGE